MPSTISLSLKAGCRCPVVQALGDHAMHAAAAGQRRIGQNAHQALVRAAIDHRDAPPRQRAAQCGGCVFIGFPSPTFDPQKMAMADRVRGMRQGFRVGVKRSPCC
jgi:hypothetical protein